MVFAGIRSEAGSTRVATATVPVITAIDAPATTAARIFPLGRAATRSERGSVLVVVTSVSRIPTPPEVRTFRRRGFLGAVVDWLRSGCAVAERRRPNLSCQVIGARP